MLQVLTKCSDPCGGNENRAIGGDRPLKIRHPRHSLNFSPMFSKDFEATFSAQAAGTEMIIQSLTADLTERAAAERPAFCSGRSMTLRAPIALAR